MNEWARYDPFFNAALAQAYVCCSLGEQAPPKLKHALIKDWSKIDPAAAADWIGAIALEHDPAISRASAAIDS